MSNAAARIGPNAVIRLAEALDAIESKAVTRKIFIAANLEAYVHAPPQAMVPEEDVTELHRRLRREVGQPRAASVSWIAGQRTADYLLSHRIPGAVQRLLKLLPRRIASFVLLKAIGAHAWTFAGTSHFSWRMGRPITLMFKGCPLCRGDHSTTPCCSYYSATFERLFRKLINADATVTEVECTAAGGEACRFEIGY